MAVHDVGIAESPAVSRPAGYVLGGTTSYYGSEAIAAINEIVFSTMATSTLGATMPSLKSVVAAVCSLTAGYSVGGEDTSDAKVGSVSKFSISPKTAAGLAASLPRTRSRSAGYSTNLAGFVVGGSVTTNDGYVSKVTFATDALSDEYNYVFDSPHERRFRPASVSDSTNGYVCGGFTASYAAISSIAKITASSTSFLSATLSYGRANIVGASSKTKGYIVGMLTQSDILDFATGTTSVASGTNYPTDWYGGISSCVGNSKAFFAGGYDLDNGVPVSAIYSAAFSTGAMALESATLSTAVATGAGIDSQDSGFGGADAVSTATRELPSIAVATIEGSGTGAGFFSGGADSGGYSRGYVHRLRFDTETLELIYSDSFGQNGFISTNGFGGTSLVNGTDMYFLGGKAMVVNNPAVLETATMRKMNALTLTLTSLTNTYAGKEAYFGVGLSYNRAGAGFLIGHPVADSHLIYKYFYATDTASSIYIAPVVGNELCGYSFGTDYGYIFGGNVDSARIFRLNQMAETAAVISATLPSGRYRPSSVNLADNGLIAGGQNVDGSVKYSSMDGFLGTTEASRTSSAALGVARGGMGAVSGYTKGYFGSTFIPYTYTAQFVDSVTFATETSVQTAATLSLCGSTGASYAPENGFGAAATHDATGSASISRTEAATADSTHLGSIPRSLAIGATATAIDMSDGIAAMFVSIPAAASAEGIADGTMIAFVSAEAAVIATNTVFVSGIDLEHTEATSAGADQLALVVFAVSTSAGASGQADQSAASVKNVAIDVGASAGSTSAAEKPVNAEASGQATGVDTLTGRRITSGVITESGAAAETAIRGEPATSDNPATATADFDATRYNAGLLKGITEHATATALIAVSASIYNASITGAAAAGALVSGFMVSINTATASGQADSDAIAAVPTTAARAEGATAGATAAATGSMSVLSAAQCHALEQAFVTSVLNVEASAALLAIVSAYAAILGEGIKPDQHFVVARVGQQYIVSRLNQNHVLMAVGQVVVSIAADGAVVLTKDMP